LPWLNKGNNLQVTKRVLILFSIGKNYQDHVLYDISSIDACHLLLRVPWQFDRKVMHDSRENTYSFLKEQKLITLAPLSPSMIQKIQLGEESTRKENLFLNEIRVERAISKHKNILSLPMALALCACVG